MTARIEAGEGRAKINLGRALEALAHVPGVTAAITRVKIEKRDANGKLIAEVENADHR
jgi:hypothetical protein